jgi:hypothetical protein
MKVSSFPEVNEGRREDEGDELVAPGVEAEAADAARCRTSPARRGLTANRVLAERAWRFHCRNMIFAVAQPVLKVGNIRKACNALRMAAGQSMRLPHQSIPGEG